MIYCYFFQNIFLPLIFYIKYSNSKFVFKGKNNILNSKTSFSFLRAYFYTYLYILTFIIMF
jgi:hypothetical protein